VSMTSPLFCDDVSLGATLSRMNANGNSKSLPTAPG
jgi:hypothetical protein